MLPLHYPRIKRQPFSLSLIKYNRRYTSLYSLVPRNACRSTGCRVLRVRPIPQLSIAAGKHRSSPSSKTTISHTQQNINQNREPLVEDCVGNGVIRFCLFYKELYLLSARTYHRRYWTYAFLFVRFSITPLVTLSTPSLVTIIVPVHAEPRATRGIRTPNILITSQALYR